ncbi:magnesium transporter [Endothiovibrio diazotrophicus]
MAAEEPTPLAEEPTPAAPVEAPNIPELLGQVLADLKSGEAEAIAERVEELHPAEVADLLESLPPKERLAVWEEIPEARDGEVLPHLGEEARAAILDEMEQEELVAAAGMMAEGDLALVLDTLPEAQTERLLQALDEDHRARVERVLSFEEGSAGRLMVSDVVSVRGDVTLAVVLRWLRRHRELPPHTDGLMVIDEAGRYLGRLAMADVVTGDADSLVAEAMQAGADVVAADLDWREVSRLFERRDLVSVAVVDGDGMLIGRITVDEVVDLIRQEADEQIMKGAGLSEEEDLFAPIVPSARRRAVWLGVNLATVFLASWVIGRFEHALEQIVALAVLLPVVASMGGIAGSQTLALTLRGMTLERIARSNVGWLARKEVAVGLLNGVAWAVVVGLVAWAWFGERGIGLVIAAAMVLNLVAATASGVVVPLTLKRLGVDPALSAAVVLTTVTDVVGFLSFLGLATLFLL